jgi:pimeloyl-ACP methyl ester carboxylesterase
MHTDVAGIQTTDDSVDINLPDLDAFIHEVFCYVQRRNPAITQVDLVGHSMGGVLARKWLRQGDNARLVRRLVALDSPNHGMQEKWLREERSLGGWSRFNQDFVLGSPWLAELNTPPEVPPSVRALAVYDGTGLVSFTATPLSPRLEGSDNLPYNVERGARIDHTGYVYDPGVLRAVFEWLQR